MKNEPARASASAQSVTTGGRRPRAEYLGARNARFAIFPGSGLARKAPDWIVAAELVETSRLWARTVARIEPEWVEPLAAHLVKRSYSEPHWEKKQGGAVALEKVTLYGVPIVTDRKVSYGRIDPAAARELFIRHALVEGDWQTSHRFFAENRRLLAEAEELEHRVRRRGLVIGEDELFAFYDARIPAEVVSAQHFDTWWKQARRADPDLLTFKAGDLLSEDAAQVSRGLLPGHLDLAVRGARGPAPVLRFRARQRHRRRDRGHPAEQAQPGERGRVLLAGARAADRVWSPR